MDIELFLNNATKCWHFALDVTWDQNQRNPNINKGECLKDRSFFRTLLGTDQIPLYFQAIELANTVKEKEEMDILLPQLLEYMKTKYPPSLNNKDFEEGMTIRYATLLRFISLRVHCIFVISLRVTAFFFAVFCDICFFTPFQIICTTRTFQANPQLY